MFVILKELKVNNLDMVNKSDIDSFSLKTAVTTLRNKAHPDGIYVESILTTFGSRSHAFIILLFCLPFVQPVPLMGLSTPLGIIILIQGIFLSLDKRPWLPKKFLKYHLRADLIGSCCKTLIKILERTEKFIRPRHSSFVRAKSTRILNGMLVVIFAWFLALPLPIPFSNSIPAYFLLLNAVALLEEDGALLIVSYIVALAGFVFFFSLGLGAFEIFDWLRIKL